VNPERYVCDTNALINLKGGGDFLDRLEWLAQEERLFIPVAVFLEVCRGSDVLEKKMRRWRQRYPGLIVDTRVPGFGDLWRTYELRYRDPFDYPGHPQKGLKNQAKGCINVGADAQCLALAKTREAVLVSDDKMVSAIAALEGIPRIDWMEFARRLGTESPPAGGRQLDLFLSEDKEV